MKVWHHQHKISLFILPRGKLFEDFEMEIPDFLSLWFQLPFRTKWEIEIKAHGMAGHGMLLLKDTAGEKLHNVIGKFLTFRKCESEKLENNPELTIADVTTVNLTMISGGTQGK